MSDRPMRVQLRRSKGWRMPPNTVKVDRSTKCGNPFTVKHAEETGYRFTDERAGRAFVVECFRDWARGSDRWWMGPESDARRATMLACLPDLRGKNIGCWCGLPEPGEPDLCHGAVVLEMANA